MCMSTIYETCGAYRSFPSKPAAGLLQQIQISAFQFMSAGLHRLAGLHGMTIFAKIKTFRQCSRGSNRSSVI